MFNIETASDYLLICDIFKDHYGSIPKDSIVIDIGAHKGVFSIFAAQTAGTVYSYEPCLKNIEILRLNIFVNNLTNIFPSRYAIAGKKGNVQLNLGDSSLGHSLYFKKGKKKETESVEAITLDDIFQRNKIKTCDVFKIDCEGAEFEIMFNAKPSTIKKIKRIIMEVHPHDEYHNNDMIEFLVKSGFIIKTKYIGSYLHIFGERKSNE
jgi:FkbM family methyltransferase